MATGILGKSAPSAATNTVVYTVPSSKIASVTVSVCNRGDTSATVRLALAATGTPASTEYIEYDQPVIPSGVLERSGIVLQAGANVVVYTSTANTSVIVYGYEEDA